MYLLCPHSKKSGDKRDYIGCGDRVFCRFVVGGVLPCDDYLTTTELVVVISMR